MKSHANSAAAAADAESRARIIDRVRKLMAFRDGTATEAEVENALSLASRLMEQHAIDREEVAAAGGGGRDGSDSAAGPPRARGESPLGGNVAHWEVWLAIAVREAVPGVSYYTNSFYGDGSPNRPGQGRRSWVFWYGPEAAVEIARMLFDETRVIIATLAAGMYGGCYRGRGRSYAEGFAQALYRRVQREREQSERREQVTAIVRRDAAANDQWLAREHGVHLTRRSSRRGGTVDQEAFEHGRSDGQRHEFSGIRPRVQAASHGGTGSPAQRRLDGPSG